MNEHSLFLDYNNESEIDPIVIKTLVSIDDFNSADLVGEYLEDYEGYPFIITKSKKPDDFSPHDISADDLTSIYLSVIDGVIHVGSVEPLDLEDPITISALKFANNIMSNFYGDDTDVSTDNSGDASGRS